MDEARRHTGGSRADPCQPRSPVDERSPNDDDAAHDDRQKSGKERTVPLRYVRDGRNLVAACENFGLDTSSSWPENLCADPQARIEIDGTAANYLSLPATDKEIARTMPRCGPGMTPT
jgi:hypothetical protein